MNTRRALRWARAAIFEVSGISHRSRALLDGSRAAILMYHRVLPTELAKRDFVEDAMFVTPATFALHCDCLAENFRVLPLNEIVERMTSGKSLPDGACSITFDDGWRDNLEFALPELERRSLPATVFVVTERVGSRDAFWPDEVSRRFEPLDKRTAATLLARLGIESSGVSLYDLLDHLKACTETEREWILDEIRSQTPTPATRGRELMNWEELARMSTAGIEIESHGATHAILTGLPEDDMVRELRQSRDTLWDHGHGQGRTLAYPSGAHDQRVVESARSLGYRAAVTTQRGTAAAADDPLRWSRIGIHEDISRSRVEFLYAVPGRR